MNSVVVVGAGLAGLGCAWKLRGAGCEVEVLDAQPRAGGRTQSEVRDGFALESGATRFDSADRLLQGVARQLGIGDRLREIPRRGELALCEGRFERSDFGSPACWLTSQLLSARSKARLLALDAQLAAFWRRLAREHLERAVELDSERLDAALERALGRECVERYLASDFAHRFGCAPDELSRAFGWTALRSRLGGVREQCFAGGVGALIARLAEEVPLRLCCEVERIETETDGARVHYRRGDRAGRVVADAVVVAVPGDRVQALCPKLTPDERGFFEQVRYARQLSVSLLLERAPRLRGFNALLFPPSAGIGLVALDAEHHKPAFAPPRAGLFRAQLARAATDRLWHATDAELVDFVTRELARTPIGRLRPQAHAIARCDAFNPIFYPGYLAQRIRFDRRIDRSPRLFFAGDYLAGAGLGAALASGLRAADEIAATRAPRGARSPRLRGRGDVAL